MFIEISIWTIQYLCIVTVPTPKQSSIKCWWRWCWRCIKVYSIIIIICSIRRKTKGEVISISTAWSSQWKGKIRISIFYEGRKIINILSSSASCHGSTIVAVPTVKWLWVLIDHIYRTIPQAQYKILTRIHSFIYIRGCRIISVYWYIYIRCAAI